MAPTRGKNQTLVDDLIGFLVPSCFPVILLPQHMPSLPSLLLSQRLSPLGKHSARSPLHGGVGRGKDCSAGRSLSLPARSSDSALDTLPALTPGLVMSGAREGGLSATAGARSPRRPRPEVWLAVCKRDYEQNTSAVKMSQLPGKSQQFPSSTTAPSFLCLIPNCFESHPCAHSPGSAARCPPSAASPRPPTPHLHGTVLLLEAEP